MNDIFALSDSLQVTDLERKNKKYKITCVSHEQRSNEQCEKLWWSILKQKHMTSTSSQICLKHLLHRKLREMYPNTEINLNI